MERKLIVATAAAAFAAALALTGCEKTPGGEDGGQVLPVTGQWHLASWSSITSDMADVYISFEEDGTFDLYQRVYTPYYEHFDGTYQQDGDQLSGTYSDGVAWNTTYTVSVTPDRSQLTLTGADDPEDVAVYAAGTIPEDILSGELSSKSSAEPETFRFL